MNLHHVLVRLARRGLIAFCALFALLTLLGTQALPVSAATTPSFIRLINASPDVGTVDVFVDGTRFLENARFASVTDYLQLPSGPHKVELALIGKGVSAAVLMQKLSVQAGAAYTVAAVGTKSTGFSLQVFVDDNRMVNGMATVRVYNLSPRSGTLSVAAGTNPLVGAVAYRQASNYQKLAAGPYTFTFRSSQPSFALADQVTLKTDMVTSLFLVGIPYGAPPLQVIHVQVKGLPRILAGTGGDPNALPLPANASEIAPLIALALGVLALTGIAIAWFTRFWPFSRQKSSSRLRPRKVLGAALGALLALILSLGGLSFASFMTHPAPPAPSARLVIPAIGVNAIIESVGVQPSGAMDTPRQSPWSDVGLYTGGARPGDRGSAVIAGHLDRPGGNPAVFWLLRELQVGDEIQIVDAHGKVLLFHVTRIEAYPVQDAPLQAIFGNTNGRFLNLTTCSGDWIPSQHQRNMRLVVYTSVGPAPANTSADSSSTALTSPPSSSKASPSTAVHSPPSNAAPSGAVPSSPLSSVSSRVVPSSPSSSVSSGVVPSSSSSSVSSIPTATPSQLPAALRPPVTVKLPGVSPTSPGIVPSTIKQAKQSPVLSQSAPASQRSITRVASQLLNKLLHQNSSPVTNTPAVDKLVQPTSSTIMRTPVVGTLRHQVSNSLTNIPVVSKPLHRVSNTLTQTSVVSKSLHQVSKLTCANSTGQ